MLVKDDRLTFSMFLDDTSSRMRVRRETVCVLYPVCSLHFVLTDWVSM